MALAVLRSRSKLATVAATASFLAGLTGLTGPSVGCGGKKKAEPGAAPDVDGLAALGAGVQVVVGGDVEKLVASRLVRRGVSAMLAADPELKTRVEAIISDCELEPGENLESFLIGLGEGPTDLVLVLTGAFEENALTACVQKRLLEGGGRLAAVPLGARTIYRAESSSDADPVWFALGSKRTLILAGSEAWLKNGLGEGSRLTDNPEIKALLAAAPVTAALWATGLIPDVAANMLISATGGAIERPRSMTAQMGFEAGVQAELTAEMAREKDAKSLKDLHNIQAPMIAAMAQAKGLGRLASKIEVEAHGKQLVIRLRADEAELSDLFAAVDTDASSQQNPPSPEPDDGEAAQGDKEHGQGNTPSDGKAPPRR